MGACASRSIGQRAALYEVSGDAEQDAQPQVSQAESTSCSPTECAHAARASTSEESLASSSNRLVPNDAQLKEAGELLDSLLDVTTCVLRASKRKSHPLTYMADTYCKPLPAGCALVPHYLQPGGSTDMDSANGYPYGYASCYPHQQAGCSQLMSSAEQIGSLSMPRCSGRAHVQRTLWPRDNTHGSTSTGSANIAGVALSSGSLLFASCASLRSRAACDLETVAEVEVPCVPTSTQQLVLLGAPATPYGGSSTTDTASSSITTTRCQPAVNVAGGGWCGVCSSPSLCGCSHVCGPLPLSAAAMLELAVLTASCVQCGCGLVDCVCSVVDAGEAEGAEQVGQQRATTTTTTSCATKAASAACTSPAPPALPGALAAPPAGPLPKWMQPVPAHLQHAAAPASRHVGAHWAVPHTPAPTARAQFVPYIDWS